MLVPVPKAVPGSSSAGASRGRTPASGTVTAIGGQPLRDRDMLAWCAELVEAVFAEQAPPAGTKA
jgi:hypothetical protein